MVSRNANIFLYHLYKYLDVPRLQFLIMSEPFKIIGRGAFGEVRVCRHKKSDEVVAIKKMKKNEMIYKNQEKHVRAERDILAIANNNPWIVTLKCSF